MCNKLLLDIHRSKVNPRDIFVVIIDVDKNYKL